MGGGVTYITVVKFINARVTVYLYLDFRCIKRKSLNLGTTVMKLRKFSNNLHAQRRNI